MCFTGSKVKIAFPNPSDIVSEDAMKPGSTKEEAIITTTKLKEVLTHRQMVN